MRLREQVTAVLAQAGESIEEDRRVLDRLVPLVYDELRRLAHRQLAREGHRLTLDTTALVHEAWLKLVDRHQAPVGSRAYFFGAAARAMRQVLVDAARRRRRHKRGGGITATTLEEESARIDATADEVLALDLALGRLAAAHPRPARVMELRCFAGLGVDETAELLGVAARTVNRDLAFAQAWLRAELGASNGATLAPGP